MLGLSLGVKSPPVMRKSAGLGQTLTALPVAAYARWHPAFSVVSLSAGRVVAASDMQGVAGLTEGVAGNGPQALTDGNGRKFWRFSESEFLNIAAGLTLDNRNASVFFVGRAHRASSATPIFSGGNVAQGSQLSGGGLMDIAMASVSAPFLRCCSRAGSLDAVNAPWMVAGSQMQVMGTTSRTTANGAISLFLNDRKAAVAQNTISRPVLTGGEIGRNPTSITQLGGFDLYELIVYNTALSDVMATATQSALMASYAVVPISNQIVLEGDSITQGTGPVNSGLSCGVSLADPAAARIPAGWRVVNMGTSGNQVSHLLAKRDVASSWSDMKIPSGQNVLVFEIGRNDFGSGALTAAQHYANVVAYLNTATTGVLQRGWTVRELANIAGAPALQLQAEPYRAMIRAPQFLTDTQTGAGQAYVGKLSIISTDLIQYNGETVFFDATDAADLTYYAGDNTHPNVLGASIRVTGGSTPQYGIAYGL